MAIPALATASDQQAASTVQPVEESDHHGGGDADVKGHSGQVDNFPVPLQGKIW